VPRTAREQLAGGGAPQVDALLTRRCYGALSTEPTPLPVMDVLGRQLTVRGYVVLEITNNPKRLKRAERFVNEGLANGNLKPIIAKTFPLEKIVEAHRFLESNQQFGKIVVTV
jgi:NADPH:quinone reductase